MFILHPINTAAYASGIASSMEFSESQVSMQADLISKEKNNLLKHL